MKRLLSITLLLSAVTVQAADGSKQRSILSNAVSSLANAFSGESSTDETELTSASRPVPAAAVASTRNLQQEVATITLAGANGAADELLGAGGSEQLAALMAKLQDAGKEPTVANVLFAAQMTTAMAAQLAPHFNAEGLAKVKAGCCKGAQKGLAAQAGAPTRGGRKVAFVKIKLTVEEAQAVHQLLGAISTAKAAIPLTEEEKAFATHTKNTLQTRTRSTK